MARKRRSNFGGMDFGEPPPAWRTTFAAGNLAPGRNDTSPDRYDNPRGYVGLKGVQYGIEGEYSDYLITKSIGAHTWGHIHENRPHPTSQKSEAGMDVDLSRKRKPL